MMPALRTEGLAKSFTLHLQGGTRIPVLGGVDLAVHPGECVALWGPSGAGKSTLMRCLYGNYGAGAGRIVLRHRGEDLDLATADPRIVIEARREGSDVLLSVTDHGPGIPEPDRQRAVERFVRLEASRTQPGSGLGLSLASAVATLHGGDLRLADSQPGLRVTLVIPNRGVE